MKNSGKSNYLEITNENLEQLILAVRDTERVNSSTHTLYQYPASFSPKFAQTVIELFSKKGDTILDLFAGGGTSAIESLRLGRNIIANDLNELAYFVSKIKTTKLAKEDQQTLENWLDKYIDIERDFKIGKFPKRKTVPQNMDKPFSRKYLDLIDTYKLFIKKLKRPKAKDFATLILLKTAKRVIDGNKEPLGLDKFKELYIKYFKSGLADLSKFSKELVTLKKSSKKMSKLKLELLNINSQNIADINRLKKYKPKLIVTSPPYAGVNIPYTLWQIKGKLNSDLPYYILDTKQKYKRPKYLMGSQNKSIRGVIEYMDLVRKTFKQAGNLLGYDGYICQLVGFSNIDEQLDRYLYAMELAGYQEYKIKKLNHSSGDGRIWRDVPSRRWYAKKKGLIASSREVLLIHKKRQQYLKA